MMDERKAAILRAVVNEYVTTASPVGSGHVVRSPGVDVSPATVRNEMVTLEHEGYLAQPHTSAGRIPTDKGYRFFVDQLAAPGVLEPVKLQQVREFFATAHGELERMLEDTTRLLSNLTDYAAVVVSPAHEATTIRSVQLVGLGATSALVVVVLADGAVEKRTIDIDEDTDPSRLAAAGAHLANCLIGKARVQVQDVSVPPIGDRATDLIVRSATGSLVRPPNPGDSDQVYVGGVSRMATAFDAVETVRSVLGTLEQQYLVVSLLRDILDRGLSVAIGTEHGFAPLEECAVVVAPFGVAGEEAGTIGLLGPTRMNYSQALAAVAVVSHRLGRHLSEGG